MKTRTLMGLCIAALIYLVIFSSIVTAQTFKLPDTGQTKCYQGVSPYAEIPCEGTGQDGAYNINPMSFTDNGNGTVTDNNTGLMWQKCSVGQNNDASCIGTAASYNWYRASGTYHATYNPSSQNVCGSLTLAGYSDWRLPTKKEAMSIVDYSIPRPGPTINTTYFPNTWWYQHYWLSTTYAPSPHYAWRLEIYDGYFGPNDKSVNYSVRCVRGGQYPEQSFVDNKDGTVTDNATALMWQKREPGNMTWDAALSYCEGLTLGGHSDWRLPNIKELKSITDDTRSNPVVDTAYFPNAIFNPYLSSTTVAHGPGVAWTVSFDAGVVSNGCEKNSRCLVRCVRGGQGGSLGDTTPPTTTLSSTPISPDGANGWFRTAPSITLTRNEAGTTFYRWHYEGNWTTYTSPFTAPQGNNTLYYYSVDTANNPELPKSAAFPVDSVAPSTPSNLRASAVSSSQINLSWNASTDATSGMGGYRIYNADTNAELAATSATSHSFTGLTASTTYRYYVRAYDNAGNLSSQSSIVSATTYQSSVPTSSGTNVTVDFGNGLRVTFSGITTPGTTSLSIYQTPPYPLPPGFSFIAIFYDISTTAGYTPPITVTLPYDESRVVGQEANLRMFHWESGRWADVTVSVDTVNNTITGRVNSLSPFGIGYYVGSGGYSTGANTNVISLLALFAISAGLLILRRNRWIKDPVE